MSSLLKSLSLLLLTVATAWAHGPAKVAGPNGGRILDSVTPAVEFLVTAERKVQFTFLDDHGQPIAPAGQSVIITTGSRSAPVTVTFSRQGDVLLSDTALPAARTLPVVIQLRPAPGLAEVIERLVVNLETCSECGHHEYACTCGH